MTEHDVKKEGEEEDGSVIVLLVFALEKIPFSAFDKNELIGDDLEFFTSTEL